MGWNPFGGGDADEYLKKTEQMLNQYYSPYTNAGQNAIPILENQYAMMLQDPAAIQQLLGGSYQQSPGYQYQYDQAMNGQNAAAAAGGMLGTPAHQQQAAGVAAGEANKDYWNYYGANEDLYKQGITGNQNLYNGGLNATNSLTQGLSNVYGSQANLSASQNQMLNQMLASGIGAAGYAFGGPAGGMAASGATNAMGLGGNSGGMPSGWMGTSSGQNSYINPYQFSGGIGG
jgi:hypothetical protein